MDVLWWQWALAAALAVGTTRFAASRLFLRRWLARATVPAWLRLRVLGFGVYVAMLSVWVFAGILHPASLFLGAWFLSASALSFLLRRNDHRHSNPVIA